MYQTAIRFAFVFVMLAIIIAFEVLRALGFGGAAHEFRRLRRDVEAESARAQGRGNDQLARMRAVQEALTLQIAALYREVLEARSARGELGDGSRSSPGDDRLPSLALPHSEDETRVHRAPGGGTHG